MPSQESKDRFNRKLAVVIGSVTVLAWCGTIFR